VGYLPAAAEQPRAQTYLGADRRRRRGVRGVPANPQELAAVPADTQRRFVRYRSISPARQTPVELMKIEDVNNIDPAYSQILVFFNANRQSITHGESSTVGKAFKLHPVQAASVDAVVRGSAFDAETGEFSIPGLTASVFVLED